MNEWTKDYKGRWIVPKPERHWLSEKEVKDYAQKEHGFKFEGWKSESESEPRKSMFVRDEELRSISDKGCFVIETWLDFYGEHGIVSVTTYLVRCEDEWLIQKEKVQVGRTRYLEIGDMASFRYFLYLDSYQAKRSLGIDTMGSDIYDEVVEYRNGKEKEDEAFFGDCKKEEKKYPDGFLGDAPTPFDDGILFQPAGDDFLSVAPTETAQEEKPADDTFAKSVDGKHRKSFLNILKEMKARGEKV